MILPSTNRKKRGELHTGGSDKIPQALSERRSAEEDEIDASIRRSIDKFGA